MKNVKFWLLGIFILFSSVIINAQNVSPEFKESFPRLGKGGVGIISDGLFVVTKSLKNEVVLKNGKRWSGLSSSKPQVVFVLNGEVVENPSVVSSFDISKAVLISFQDNGIYFYDFPNSSSGNYLRNVE